MLWKYEPHCSVVEPFFLKRAAGTLLKKKTACDLHMLKTSLCESAARGLALSIPCLNLGFVYPSSFTEKAHVNTVKGYKQQVLLGSVKMKAC